MKKILWIGEPYFSTALKGEGVEIIRYYPRMDETLTWKECISISGGVPDLVTVADNSRPPYVLGVEKFPCPTILYAVDTHIHSWLPWYAQAFDACLVSLKDHLPLFRKRLAHDRLLWSPPFASSRVLKVKTTRPRDLDVVFIGTMSETTTPIRVAFFRELQKRFPDMLIQSGDYYDFFPRAKIVVNICEKGDLNFRVFETLGLGAALLTPDIGNGQNDIVKSGTHIVTYPFDLTGSPDSIALRAVQPAAEVISWLLENEDTRQTIATAGHREVIEHHLDIHRAEKFLKFSESISTEEVRLRLDNAPSILNTYLKLVYLHWAENSASALLRKRYLTAATGTLC